ncbi:MAG: NAD(P)H-dependent flavin oxidoreductase [Acidimicrobiales bacterium]
METAFTKLVGCRVPLQQAGMGGTATPELAAAVTAAGGLGTLASPVVSAAAATAALDVVESRTSGPVGYNFLVPFLDLDAVIVAASRARVVEFFYGDPDAALVALVHEQHALACWQVGSVSEAAMAADAGCDFVVAQGVEAGGHVRGEIGLLVLLDQVLAAIDVPVVAAGGIGSARAMAAVLAAGAAGARVGTRFVVAEEADAHPAYVDALIAAEPEDTVVTTTFSVEWPDAPHRVLQSCIDAAEAMPGDPAGHIELDDGRRLGVPRRSVLPPGRHTTGAVGAMAQYAGQSVGSVRARQPAGDIVRELAGGAERLLARLG